MSSKGLSKADREIIAQGKLAEKASNEKHFGVGESSVLEKSSRSVDNSEERLKK